VFIYQQNKIENTWYKRKRKEVSGHGNFIQAKKIENVGFIIFLN